MNWMSLFDGMSCAQMAINKLGLPVTNYYTSELDKFAIQQTQHNFPNTIQLGDVTKVSAKDLPKIDFLIGGSPCQGFSFAGKQLNFDDERSKLFFEYVHIWKEIKEINPDAKFLLENVNMKKEHMRVISKYLGVDPINLNSNLVSAQNRNRWYWTNIKTKSYGMFSTIRVSDIPQPVDREIYLEDIVEPECDIDQKYYLTQEQIIKLLEHKAIQDQKGNGFGVMIKTLTDKAGCITTGEGNRSTSNYIKLDKQLNLKGSQGKASCLTGGGHSGGNHSDMDVLCVAMRGRQNEKGEWIQELEPQLDGKTNCLTSTQKDNLLAILRIQGIRKGAIFFDKSPTITSSVGEHNHCLLTTHNLRRLTPRECMRLQTVPEEYEQIVSDSQMFKMLGNGFTVEMIVHIINQGKWI